MFDDAIDLYDSVNGRRLFVAATKLANRPRFCAQRGSNGARPPSSRAHQGAVRCMHRAGRAGMVVGRADLESAGRQCNE